MSEIDARASADEATDRSFDLPVAAVWEQCAAADPSHGYLLHHRLPRHNFRQVDAFLVVPLQNLEGHLIGLRLISESGIEDVWPRSAESTPFILEGSNADRVIIVRGSVADAIAVHMSGNWRVLQVPISADSASLRDALIVRWPNLDVMICEPTAALAKAHVRVGLPVRHVAVAPQGLSWTELYRLSGAEGIRSWIDDPVLQFAGVTPPQDLVARSSGLWTDDEEPCRVCGPVAVVALAHDEEQDGWSRVVYLQDRDGHERFVVIPEPDLALSPRRVVSRLINAGLEIRDASLARQLIGYLARSEVDSRFVLVTRGGWHRHHYVTQKGTIGPTRDVIPVLDVRSIHAPTPSSARIASWQRHIGQLAEGNSRLVIALGVAFGGLVQSLMESHTGIGVHLPGTSSLGKTTALRVAGSIYGSARSQVGSWRSTDAGLEVMAIRHHDRALLLDELAQIAPDAAAQAAYTLMNGIGRQRFANSGNFAPVAKWSMTVLSSGEISLEDKVAERPGLPCLREGQMVRLIDVAADAKHGHGLYEELHGHENGAQLSDALNRAADDSEGDVALAFAAAVADDIDGAKTLLKTERDRFVQDHLPAGADGITRRVFANLGQLAAACELATHYRILPWRRGSGHAGIAACARTWLANWQQRNDAASPVTIARDWLAVRRDALKPWSSAAHVQSAFGFIREDKNLVYLTTEGWQSLSQTVGSIQMQRALTEAGCFSYAPARVPGGKPRKFYTIDQKLLGEACGGPLR